MKLGELIVPKALVPELKSVKRDDVIAELVDALVASGVLTKTLREDIIAQIVDREKKGSTGFGKGVAVPHVKHAKIKKIAATIGVSQRGVDFNALDKQPVYSVVLLVSPIDRPDQHLQAMEGIFRNLQKDTFRRFLRQATTAEEIIGLLDEADSHQLQD